MADAFSLSSDSRATAGVLLIAIVAVEYGGWFVLRVVRGRTPSTPFQQTFYRAGHAHAAVLVTLALVAQVLVNGTHLSGIPALLAADAIPWAAVLMPAGFFLSAVGRDRKEPNQLIVLLYAGIVSLGVGVLSLGIGLLMA